MLPDWECPRCHAAVPCEKTNCNVCGTSRPSSLTPSESRKQDDLRQASQNLRDSLRRQSKSILDEISNELSSTLRDSTASLDRLGSALPNISDIRTDIPAATLGRFADSSAKADPVAAQRAGSPFEKVTTRHLQVETAALPRLNYALVHCGLPLIPSLEIRNTSREAALDVLIKAWVATDFGEPWQKTVAWIPPGGSHIETNIVIPLRKSRLQEVREAEQSTLRIDIFTEGQVQISETHPLEVLAYNEWFYHPLIPQAIASFVQPNSEATEKIISLVRDRLRADYQETDLSGYQAEKPEKVVLMLEALYKVIQRDLKISYINPPASFESGQKVFLPEQIYEHRRGTCLDLALLAAGCVERMGLNPLIFLIRGHAFFGVWLAEQHLDEPVLRKVDAVNLFIDAGRWLPLNSTTWTSSPPRTFEDCLEHGRKFLLVKPEGFLEAQEDFNCVIDITSARRAGLKPIPPLVSGG